MSSKCTQQYVDQELAAAKDEVSRMLADGFKITHVNLAQRSNADRYDGSREAMIALEIELTKPGPKRD